MRRAEIVELVTLADLVGRDQALLDQDALEREELRLAGGELDVVVLARRMAMAGRVAVGVIMIVRMVVTLRMIVMMIGIVGAPGTVSAA
jgi:hypothetical protein